ncbi:tRNA (guanosine(18)-2'-O)-methyltransferase [Elysia marginata]|uniref:tRNA (guanosine(18)-2'-O)-methyltransferase TARBP1 n=1 Tax=Elysia marginata TaxID=1093978 RepID=A0AAV4HJJ8_9GAST|nr:tRNA (guanosine(18)-2'-O)-methyltransferase [Elysia marginata]
MASEEFNSSLSLNTVIFHATTSLEAKLKDSSGFSDSNLKSCLGDIKSLSQLLTILDQFNSSANITDAQEELLLRTTRDVCFPLLYSLHLLSESENVNSEKGRALSVLVNLVLTCCKKLRDQSLSHVVTQLLIPLCTFTKDPNHVLLPLADEVYHKTKIEPLNQFLSLEILNILLTDSEVFQCYLSNVSHLGLSEEDLLAQLFHAIVCCAEESSAFSKAFTVVAKLFEIFPVGLRKKCEDELWTCYTQPLTISSRLQESKQGLWKSLYVSFCLKNYFFPLDASLKDVLALRLLSDNFWSTIQAGLVSSEPLHRKLAVYLIKRLIDTCEKNDCTVNVIHRPDMRAPIFWWSSAAKKQLSALWEDFILIIEVLEEKQVHVIKPVLPRMQRLVKSTSESSEEGTELGKSSPVAEALKVFFVNLFGALNKEQKVQYLDNLLRIVCDNSWGSIPLFFVFEGLSLIPPDPIIDSELLHLVRQILQSCLTTHESVTKGAIQCFICQMLINLTHTSAVTLKETMRALAPLNREESLQRGTFLWASATNWLGQAVKEKIWTEDEAVTQALAYLRDPQAAKSSVSVEGYRVVATARMLVLFADVAENQASTNKSEDLDTIQTVSSGSLESEKSISEAVMKSPLGRVLEEIVRTLSDIRTRAYIDVGLVDRCLSLLYSLSKEVSVLNNSAVNKLLKRTSDIVFKEVSHFVKARVSLELTKIGDLDHVKFYSDVLLSLGFNSEHVDAEMMDILTFVIRIFDKSQEKGSGENVEDMDILVLSSLRLLKTLCELTELRIKSSNAAANTKFCAALVSCIKAMQTVPQPFSRKSTTVKNGSSDGISKANVGQAISSYITCKWHCLRFLFNRSLCSVEAGVKLELESTGAEPVDAVQILDAAMEDLSIGSGKSDVAIYRAVYIVMQEIVSKADPESVSTFLELSWSKVMEEKKNKLFWQKLEVLVPLALHPAILSQAETSVIGESLDEFLNKLQTLGTDKTGILFLVYENLCQKSLSKDKDPGRRLATRLIPLLIEGIYFGQVHKRGERLWLDVCVYLESTCDANCINHLTSSMSKDDLFTRVAVLNWLSLLSPTDLHDVTFAAAFLEHLRAKYLALAKLTTYKQFSNSLSHRQKHRMVLVFLLLVDFINEDMCESYLSTLWYALEIECHPSVRQNLEWLVLILFKRYPKFVDSVWDVFKLYSTRRSVCLCSLFLVLSHTGINLPQNQQAGFFKQAFTSVLPWSMAHHYNTRIFAQTAVVKMWEQCQTLQLEDVLTHFSVVQSTVDYIHNNGNASGTVLKLYENYMFHDFDPVADYSMETIFYTLPRLACLADDEWISPVQFSRWDKTWLSESGRLVALKNPTQKLAQCKAGPWRMKAHTENDEEVSESADNLGDVQKKIMPWRQMSPDQDTEAELTSKQRQRGLDGGLVLVTSLIDKVPNLGGLCRTSEIFGVSEFVIGNLTYLEDRMFQNLSVSAQKWINITEVLKLRVPEYLEEKRAQGYTLVGVEQTANSVSLQHYTFPKKTLLLLGNEKEGIPVDILQSLDVCVEIPQLGIIRSLNVHVCGALIVWEYTRQILQQQEGKE